jgi:hypothetical protein
VTGPFDAGCDPGEPHDAKTPASGGEAGAGAHSLGEGLPDDSAPLRAKSKVISCLTDLDPIRNYLHRIGAHPRSLRSAVAQEKEGRYSRDLATIHFDKETGETEVKAEDAASYEPTDLERQMIADAIKTADFPEPLPLHRVIDPPKLVQDADPENVFEFRNAAGLIVMLQVRVEKDDGKEYRPWTYWSDHRWRPCEPDGPLPLYGADKIADHAVVMLHEGAKAARAMQRLCEDSMQGRALRAAHPWGDELDGMAHVGWIGGAPNPHRTDWSALSKVHTVYLVADNDAPGLSAVPKISKALSQWSIAVRAVRFTADFPAHFDLADPLPQSAEKLLFKDYVDPAIWATRVGTSPEQKEGRGRPKAPPVVLRPEFLADWWLVAGEGKATYIGRHDRSKLYSEETFNTLVRAFSDTPRTGDLFKQKGYASTVSAIAYEPGAPEGEIMVEGERSVNTWTAPRIRAQKGAPGDYEPWLDFLTYLLPEESDRHHVMRWVATLIARPRVRMRYGLLLASTMQGVGKTTLCEILRVLVGEKNCSSPSAGHVVDSQFNSWIVRKRLVTVNEIYEGSSWRAYQKLKSYITDTHLEANEKMVKTYAVNNWAHFVLCSNAEVPISVEMEDRRFLMPKVTEQKRGGSYWSEFYRWLAQGGFALIAGWADEFVALPGNAVVEGETAPETARKTALIEDSRSACQSALKIDPLSARKIDPPFGGCRRLSR